MNYNQNHARQYTRLYSFAEEIANSITHGLGALLGIGGTAVMVVIASLHGDAWQIVSCSVFGGTLILLYLFSTLYHGLTNLKLKRLFQTLDHAAIYLLIAGTYTPIMLVSLRGALGWTIFGIVWGLALFGAIMKCWRMAWFERLSVVVCLLMGWSCLFVFKVMLDKMSIVSLVFLIAGGSAYSCGVIFYLWKKFPFNHAIWHMFVLAGSVCHYFCILFLL